MRVVPAGLLLFLVSISGFAQPPGNGGISLTSARLPTIVRKQMERELFSGMSNRYNREDIAETSKVLRVRLGPGDRWGWRMQGGYQLCGRGANCPFWLFDERSAAVLLRSEAGFDFRFLKTMHAGLYDVRIMQSIGAMDPAISQRYEFDGTQYVEVSDTGKTKADSLRE